MKKALDRKEPDEGAAIRPNDDKESITWETDICKRQRRSCALTTGRDEARC